MVSKREDLAEALQACDIGAQVNWMAGLSFKELEALYALAEGTQLSPTDFVAADGSPVHCEGKNGLKLFTRFQKRFAKLGDEIVGYNHNNWFTTFLGGPGHFVVEASEKVEGEVWINYLKAPAAQHPEFPALLDNNVLFHPRGVFSRFVYGGMVDIVRRVSTNLVIGVSWRPDGSKGLNGGMYFALVIPPHQ